MDADLRRPTQATRFGVDPAVGVTQVLAGTPLSHRCGHRSGGPVHSAAGRIPPNPSELVGSRRMDGLLTTLVGSYMVVIDAPPLLPVTDAALLSVAADGAIVVVEAGKTHTEQLAYAARKLDQVSANLLGVVLNKVKTNEVGTAIYGYGYGSDISSSYYRSVDETKSRDRRDGTPRRAKRAAEPPAEAL